jgi:hypothetical protein
MSQTRLGSFIEAWANIFIGLGINILGQLLIYPVFGIHVTIRTNLGIAALFTIVSLARSYILRRWFNARLHSWLNPMDPALREAIKHPGVKDVERLYRRYSISPGEMK